jgi:hypothetical protein
MKILIHSVQKFPRSFANPFDRVALPLFFTLAFLPSILCLILTGFSVTNPFAAISPIIAAFWLAASFREIRMSFVPLGALVTMLLWSANWIMMAGGHCCQTIN